MLHIPMKHAKGAKSDKPSAAVDQGMAKQKIYAFRTVDYPAATINTVNQYNDTTAVGYFAYPGSDATPFYFKGTTNHVLVLPNGGYAGVINGINATGVMVGSFNDSVGSGLHGFIWNGTAFTVLDYPASFGTEAGGINKAGVVVGDYYDLNGVEHGFTYSAGTYKAFDRSGASATAATGINSNGDIVGAAFYSSAWHGFLLSDKVYSAIDFPMAEETWASGINDAGVIAGSFEDSTTTHGFTETAGAFNQIDVGGGTTATGIYRVENNNNVVGSAIDSAGESHGIIGR